MHTNMIKMTDFSGQLNRTNKKSWGNISVTSDSVPNNFNKHKNSCNTTQFKIKKKIEQEKSNQMRTIHNPHCADPVA